jgi:hypothetical protein
MPQKTALVEHPHVLPSFVGQPGSAQHVALGTSATPHDVLWTDSGSVSATQEQSMGPLLHETTTRGAGELQATTPRTAATTAPARPRRVVIFPPAASTTAHATRDRERSGDGEPAIGMSAAAARVDGRDLRAGAVGRRRQELVFFQPSNSVIRENQD